LAIENFLTPIEPLGPIRHEAIMRRRATGEAEQDPVNLLIYKAKTFDINIQNVNSLIMGRRGAGKTAFVAALLAQSSGVKKYYDFRNDYPNESDDIIVFIQSWDHLDELVTNVARDCLYSLGNSVVWEELLPETAARHWERHLWSTVFQQVYKNSHVPDANNVTPRIDYRKELPLVFRYIEGRDIVDVDQEITDENLEKFYRSARDSLLAYLERSRRRCFIIIDSLDYYPVQSPRFSKIIGGFLRCITNFRDTYQNAKIYCCLPEELEARVMRGSW